MARSTKTTRNSTRRTPEPAPRKRLGRPPGSKNRVKSSTSTKAVPVVRTVRAAPGRTTAAPAPKLNKAELEAQVVKLERSIARLRKQNAELKQMARTKAREAAEAPPAPPADSRRLPKPNGAAAARRQAGAMERLAAEPPAAAKQPSKRSTKSRASRAAELDVEQELAAFESHGDAVALEE